MWGISIPMVQRSPSHLSFMFQKSISADHFSQIKYNASPDKIGERFHLVLGLIGLELRHIASIDL